MPFALRPNTAMAGSRFESEQPTTHMAEANPIAEAMGAVGNLSSGSGSSSTAGLLAMVSLMVQNLKAKRAMQAAPEAKQA